VLGEDNGRTAGPDARQAAVNERRIMMRVNDGRPVFPRQCGDTSTKRRAEAGATMQRVNSNPALAQHRGPRPGVVETTNHRRHLDVQPSSELHDELLGSARVQAEDRLEDPGRVHRRGTRSDVSLRICTATGSTTVGQS